METLTAMPEIFRAGTTLRYTRSVPDFPASDGWTLTLHLRGRSAVTKDASASGSDHLVDVAAAETAGMLPGTYTWLERVSKGNDAFDLPGSTVVVMQNLATAQAGEARLKEELWLELVELRIADRLPKDMESATVMGHGIQRMKITDLFKLRAELVQQISWIRSGGVPRVHQVHFTKVQ